MSLDIFIDNMKSQQAETERLEVIVKHYRDVCERQSITISNLKLTIDGMNEEYEELQKELQYHLNRC